MGDFNAKIGKLNTNLANNTRIGPHALDELNEKGNRLIGTACELKVANTYFKKKPKRKWTWISPNGSTKTEIDHALTNDISIIKDISPLSLSAFGFPSDHKIVKCKVRINTRVIYNNNRKKNEKLKRIFPL